MRGEHNFPMRDISGLLGSSPHARGALPIVPIFLGLLGIIPACAGSTDRLYLLVECLWDHPRMRGEHASIGEGDIARAGSSPHARGARLGDSVSRSSWGIIPACAGSTHAPAVPRFLGWDHPRMRGEHPCPRQQPSTAMGSSPHARGALVDDGIGRRGHCIIPACAGST